MAALLLVSFMATAAASQFIVTGLEAEHLSSVCTLLSAESCL
eukprot:COSAG01_NODE_4327_length_5128_cov_23.227833_7_plen_42_part_00